MYTQYLLFTHILVYFRNYLKAVLMLWTYNIAFITSENTTVVRGSINAWDSKQTYCGELLTRSIEILCVEMRIKRPRPRRPRGK